MMNSVISKAQIAFPGSPVPVDTFVFTEPEIIEAVCDVHGWMKAYIHVVEHPYYAITSENGEFHLDGIPPGKHTMSVWHETLGEQTLEVIVKPNEVSELEFVYKPIKAKK